MKRHSDPLLDPSYKAPGIIEMLREAFLGSQRPFECAQIEVSSHCAGRCLYCPHTTNREKWQGRNMEPSTFARLWPVLKLSERAHLQGWGEPLLQPRFFDMVAFARKAGCAVSTTTCGLIMDDSLADKIVDSGMDLIAFSLAGTDRKSNEIRENVDFDKVCEAITMLDRKRVKNSGVLTPEIHLAYLLLADRMESVEKLPELMDKLNVDKAVISTLDYLALQEHESIAFNPHDHEKCLRAEEILRGLAERAAVYGRQIYFSLPGANPNAEAGGCRENALRTLYVNTEGDLSPCVYLNVQGEEKRVKTYGNVNESEILSLWNGLDYVQFRNRLASGRPDSACTACPKRFEKIY